MDLTDLESNLHALEKLYELLLRNYDDEYHEPSEKLDDKARYMLKKLLDMEAERVIKAHSEIVGVYDSRSSWQLKDNGMNKKFHAGESPFEAPIDNREGLASDLSFSLKEEQDIHDPTSPTEKVNQSNMIFAASAFMNKKIRCRVCKGIKSKPSSNFSDRGGTQTPNAVNDLHPAGFINESGEDNKKRSDDDTNIPFIVPSGSSKENLCIQRGGANNLTSAVISKAVPSRSAAEASIKVKETDSFPEEEAELVSGEASAAVKRIQSHIARMHWLRLLFKLEAEILLPPKKRTTRCGVQNVSIGLMAPVIDSDVPSMLLMGGKAVDDDASGQARKTLPNSLSLPTHTMMGQIESEQNIGGNSLHDNLLDQHETSFSDNKNKSKRKMRKEHTDHGEIERTDSDYSRTNPLIGDSSNEIDLNSSSSETDTSETPSSIFESNDVYSLPRRTPRLPASATSSSESEFYSSASGSDTEIYSSTGSSGSRQDTSTSSIDRHKYSSDIRPGTKHDRVQSYSPDDAASSRKGDGVPTKTSQNSRNKKRHGGLKKLKDKLAIMFHHHHHHHHHLHHDDKNDQSNSANAKINRGKSLWKTSSKVTQLKRENEIKGEHAVEKIGKSIIRDKKRKKPHGQFYELMQGMLRHRRHSKLSKSSKLAAKQSRIHHQSEKAPNKSHWWKLLRKQKKSEKRMLR